MTTPLGEKGCITGLFVGFTDFAAFRGYGNNDVAQASCQGCLPAGKCNPVKFAEFADRGQRFIGRRFCKCGLTDPGQADQQCGYGRAGKGRGEGWHDLLRLCG